MSPTWSKSPVAEVLATVLESIYSGAGKVARKQPDTGDEELIILSYQDQQDFENLWKLPDKLEGDLLEWVLSGGESPRSIVLVWDGLPEALEVNINPDIVNFVTPVDWAVAFTKRIFDNATSGSNTKPHLRIFILDLKSQEYSNAFGCRQFTLVSSTMPWVQFYRPLQKNSVDVDALCGDHLGAKFLAISRSAITAGNLGIESLFKDILDLGRIQSLREANEVRNRNYDIDSLMGLWRNNLTRPGERHTIGNLLAPILLVKGLHEDLQKKAESHSTLTTALDVLAQTAGLKMSRDAGGNSSEGLLQELQSEGDVFGRRQKIKFLLIDDQFALGYQHILACLIFGTDYQRNETPNISDWKFATKGSELVCKSKPDILLDALEFDASDLKTGIEDWRRPRTITHLSHNIVMLDLRLWVDTAGRKQFLSRLIKICDKLNTSPLSQVGSEVYDPAFEKAYTRAKELIEDETQEISEIEALALLPLLLSHYDPSLPIVLFSSSHQREILEMVAHQPNIITDFTKPIISGYGEDNSPVTIVADLKRALQKAVKAHEARRLWERLVGIDWSKNKPDELPVFVSNKPAGFLKAVYNYGKHVPSNYVDGGSQEPRLSGNDLRIKLSEYYIHYLLKQRYFDFFSILWETLEGFLLPENILNNVDIEDAGFDMPERLTNRNYVPRVMKYMRNRKAHGNARSAKNEQEKESQRLATIFTFLLFLDFISNAKTNAGNQPLSTIKVAQYLKREYSSHPDIANLNENTIEPKHLTNSPDIDWLDFVIFTATYSMNKAVNGNDRYVSAETLDASHKLSTQILKI